MRSSGAGSREFQLSCRAEGGFAVENQVQDVQPDAGFDPMAITRPDRKLLTYYIVVSLLSTVGILPITLIVFLHLYFKYRTLHYRFDKEGIAMSWDSSFAGRSISPTGAPRTST